MNIHVITQHKQTSLLASVIAIISFFFFFNFVLYQPICHVNFHYMMFNISEMLPLTSEKGWMVKIIPYASPTPN